MKILVLTNYYPPHHIGGYGMLCLEMVDGLRERGHEVTVLSGKHGVAQDTVEGHVHRRLTLESDLYDYQMRSAWRYPLAKARNFAILRALVAMHQPDLIFIWGMWALTKALAQLAEALLPGRVAYYLANPWPLDPNLHQRFWDEPATTPLRQLAKKALRLPVRFWLRTEWQKTPLQFHHALCCSVALRDQLCQANTSLQQAPVIYEGIDLAPYLAQEPFQSRQTICNGASNGYGNGKPSPPPNLPQQGGGTVPSPSRGGLGRGLNVYTNGQAHTNGNSVHTYRAPAEPTYRLLFVGTLSEHKGVHTTIEALALLRPAARAPFHLTILGSGHPHYEARLHKLVKTHQLAAWVAFHQPIPRSALPALMGQYQVLLLPSIWEEPLARIMQEGLAAGMVVIGAATGGTKEIIVHGENGLLFPAADAAALAACLQSLVADPALARQIAETGRQTAIEKFAITRMIDDIERYLAESLLGNQEATYAAPLSL